jgi:hypothetical protein
MLRLGTFLLLTTVTVAVQPWDKYILAPASRLVVPEKISAGDGIARAGKDIFPLSLETKNSFVVFDFGQEVGGFVSIELGAVEDGAELGLTFSESTNYATCPTTSINSHCTNAVGNKNPQMHSGDDSNGGGDPTPHPDGPLWTGPLRENTIFRVKDAHLRGGFRYLNIFVASNETGSSRIEIKGVNLTFTAAPAMSNLRNYKNHFYCSDDLLNRIWYASAYTAQMCIISPQHGRDWPPPKMGWNNDVLIGVGDSIIVDGAKRDRTIWPGDMGISIATSFATLGDVRSGINSLLTLYDLQSPAGQLPYVGPAVFCQMPEGQSCGGRGSWGSDTYHLWALVGTHLSVTYSKNTLFLNDIYEKYKKAVNHSLSKVSRSPNGLFVVDQKADWQRSGQGGKNIAANALLYKVTQGAIELTGMMKDTRATQYYRNAGEALKQAINAVLWDETVNAYRDNPSSSTFPQDGNSLSVWFNVTDTADKRASVLAYLKSNWGKLGSISPEWVYQGRHAIGTFPSSMEVFAWLSSSNNEKNGISLIKKTWGYMLNSPNSTQSTFWEGFQEDGQFAFDGIYMSHAHGWSTGPAPALSFYILGLRPGKIGFYDYEVVPSFAASGLRFCEGSLSFGEVSKVFVRWEMSTGLTVDSRTFEGSVGRIALPADDKVESIWVGLSQIWDRTNAHDHNDVRDGLGLDRLVQERDGKVWFTLVKPRKITFSIIMVVRHNKA